MVLTEQEFMAEVQARIPKAKFLEASVSFDFYRIKFEAQSQSGSRYHMLLRIVYFENQAQISATLEMPKTSYTVKSAHPFFHKLKDRIIALSNETTG
jgi:hypothetical protein